MRRWSCVLAWLALAAAACGGSEADPPAAGGEGGGGAGGAGGGGGGPELPTPYVYEEPDEVEPALDPAALGEAIRDGLSLALRIDARPFLASYEGLLAGADGVGCPVLVRQSDAYSQSTFWQGECGTAAGGAFSGFGAVYTYEDLDYGDGTLYDGWYVYHSGRLAAGAATLEGSGVISYATAEPAGYTIHVTSLDGSFVLAPDAPGPWLDGTLGPSLTVFAAYVPGLDAHAIGLDGGLAGLAGPANTIAFSGVRLTEASLGSQCDREPSGTVSVRDAEGSWYDVVFDGPTDEAPDVDPAVCDGCGRTYFRGRELGATCVDFAPATAWGPTPW